MTVLARPRIVRLMSVRCVGTLNPGFRDIQAGLSAGLSSVMCSDQHLVTGDPLVTGRHSTPTASTPPYPSRPIRVRRDPMSAESPPPNGMSGQQPVVVQLDPKWYACLIRPPRGQR